MSENVAVESAGLVEDIAVIEERDAAARRLAEVLSPATIESLARDVRHREWAWTARMACSTR